MNVSHDKEKFILLKEIFDTINYKINTYNDLNFVTLEQDYLKQKTVIHKLYNLIPKLKKKYDSHTLTCLHINSINKQKFPAVNMIRQILKKNNYKLTPYCVCRGYYADGKKRLERYYKITPINIDRDQNKNISINVDSDQNIKKPINVDIDLYSIFNNIADKLVNKILIKYK